MNNRLAGLAATLLLTLGTSAQAVDYALPDLDGHMNSLGQYRGKWMVVNYWATWCGTCRKELPDLAELHEKHLNGDIVVVGINFESIETKELKRFVADHGIPYPVLRTEPVRKTPLGPVPALPTTYIVDPNGKTVAGEVGMVTRQDLEEYIDSKRGKVMAD
jgi:thiol-disulfide isomerase/thioredoxin